MVPAQWNAMDGGFYGGQPAHGWQCLTWFGSHNALLHPQCKNAEAGCLVTCPLAHQKGHQDSCPFELMACPNEGCTSRVPRGNLAEHRQNCQHGAHQRCPLGCGATLGPAERASHNCYRELRKAWCQRQERSRTLVLCLLRRMRKVYTGLPTTSAGSWPSSESYWRKMTPCSWAPRKRRLRPPPEGSIGAEMWGAQGQATL